MIDHDFFKKYQKWILRLANTKLGKFYLCSNWSKSEKRFRFNWIKTEKFIEIFPSGAIVNREYFYTCKKCIKSPYPEKQKTCRHKNKILAERNIGQFYSANHFAQKLAPFLFWLPYWKGIVAEGKIEFIPRFAFPLVGAFFGLPIFMGTVSTFNPATGSASPIDGLTSVIASDTWANHQTRGGTFHDNATTADNIGRFRADATQWDRMVRGWFCFATGATITAGSTINSTTSSKITIVGSSIAYNDNYAQSVSITTSNPASTSTLADTDHPNLGTVALGTDITVTAWNQAGANVYTLNASGLAAVATGGSAVTKMGGRLSGDRTNTEPTGVNTVAATASMLYADNGSSKPELSVDWTSPTPTSQFKTAFRNPLRPRIFGPGLAR